MAAAIAAALYARQAAAAADQSNQTSREAYIADQRPWVAVDLKISGPLRWERNGFVINLDVELENTGRSPALSVFTYIRILASDRDRKLHDEQIKISERVGKSVDPNMGINIFPGQKRTWAWHTYRPEPDEMIKHKRWQAEYFADDADEVLPAAIGCALYYSSSDDGQAVHHTPIVCVIRRKPNGDISKVISRAAGEIPANELELKWSSARGLTD